MLSIVSLFLIAQFGGLLLVMYSYTPSYIYASIVSSGIGPNPVTILLGFLINLVIAVLIIMLILRYYHGNMFFTLLEAYIIIFGSFFLFFIITGDLLPKAGFLEVALIAFAVSFLILYVKNRTKRFRNEITLISSVGAGVFIGLNVGGFLLLYLIVAAFAVYDYIAVFVLKFMLPFAKEAVNRNLAFMIGSSEVEMIPREELSKKEVAEFKKIEVQKIQDPTVKSLVQKGNMPAVSSVMLGNGDIMLPLMLTIGSYITYLNPFISVMIVIGSAAGLIATLTLLRKYKIGLPAIPPLFSFISLALFIAFLIAKPFQPLLVILFLSGAVLSLATMLFTLRKTARNVK